MKKKIFCLVFLLMLIFIPNVVLAEENNDIILYDSNSVVKKQGLFQADNNLKLSGDFDGTSFFAGNNIILNSNIKGISFVAGNDLNLSDITEYGMYVGNTIEINGNIANDLFVIGNVITINKDAIIGRDSYMMASEVNIFGNINRNVYISSESINIDNVTINGNLMVLAENISFGDNVNITGTFKYNNDAKIFGMNNTTFGMTQIYDNVYDNNKENDSIFGTIIFKLFSTLLIGLFICLIFPNILNKIDKQNFNINDCLGKIGKGLLFMIIAPFTFIILLISIVGIKLSLIGIGVYTLIMCLANVFTSYFIGNLIYKNTFKAKHNMYLSMIIGIVFIILLTYIPYIGWLIGFLSILLGIGIILNLMFSKKTNK